MRLVFVTVLAAGISTGCDTWSGPQSGSAGAPQPGDNTQQDGATRMFDAGPTSPPTPERDATAGDATAGDATAGDATAAPLRDASADGSVDAGNQAIPRGDDRAGHVSCGEASCGKGEPCCTTNGSNVQSQCAANCGATEAAVTCDGPEDCSAGQVCCHRFGASGLTTECVGPAVDNQPDASTSDASASVSLCAALAGEPERHIACHSDDDCKASSDTPLCRADLGRREFLGYCIADTDDPLSPGHDDRGVVSCGQPDQDGTGAICSLDTDICCLSRFDGTVAACAAREACGFSEVKIVCDGPEDCGGKVCCFTPESERADAGPERANSVCAAECAEGAIKRCHQDADCGGAVGSCKTDGQSTWWGTCQT